MHGSYFVAKDSLKLNNQICPYLLNLNIILHHAFSLNIYEHLKYHQHQYYDNQLKNHRRFLTIQHF